jgi:hypothetical protein
MAATLGWPVIELESLKVNHSYDPYKGEFCFLNRCVSFPDGIDWDYRKEGLLWTYNLNYFEWLYDDKLSVEARFATIKAFIAEERARQVAHQAYPISLRSVAWTRFLIRFGIKDELVAGRLYSDCQWLYRFPEYHLQGNHLWENAVSLVCAGLYFRNERFYRRGAALLSRCIIAQVLPDGGHIEGSPMYQSLLLWRLMQTLELVRAMPFKGGNMEELLSDTAAKMLGWIQQITFSNGDWPMFNDCAAEIAPTTSELQRYAGQLGISPVTLPLGASGYRMICHGAFELAIHAAPIQPAYQPGHAHADLGSFCLYHLGKPVVIDTGTSTYEESKQRILERGTAAHNTIAIGGKNSSEVWKSFRIGRRVDVLQVTETPASVTIIYKPYAFLHVKHARTFSWNDNCISITDQLHGKAVEGTCAYLHFHPNTELEQMDQFSFRAGALAIYASGANLLSLLPFQFAYGFNRLLEGRCACFALSRHLITRFEEKDFA